MQDILSQTAQCRKFTQMSDKIPFPKKKIAVTGNYNSKKTMKEITRNISLAIK